MFILVSFVVPRFVGSPLCIFALVVVLGLRPLATITAEDVGGQCGRHAQGFDCLEYVLVILTGISIGPRDLRNAEHPQP